MNQLREHNGQLKTLFELLRNNKKNSTEYNPSLDYIDSVMREYIGIDAMRDSGTFFTGDTLSIELINSAKLHIDDASIILDPTCGAGNLLIAASRKFSTHNTLKQTLEIWGMQLFGFDLYESFVEATKLRIILDAINRGCLINCTLEEALSLLPNIKVVDAMNICKDDITGITHIIMNPPFCLWESPGYDFWKKGKVNASAIIFSHYIDIMSSTAEVISILPDVLRSGSRYSSWREYITKKIQGNVNIIGQFNKNTDVDVFIISGNQSEFHAPIEWITSINDSENTLSKYCKVSVGRVVAYRDPEIGPSYPFIHPRNVPMWGILDSSTERRKFGGTVITPPFIVIRRTSRPGDKYRAIGTIIVGMEPIAVENHLIIVQPFSASFSECERILKQLQHEDTNDFLNNRIRCRHLTVEAIKQIPYSRSDE